MTVRARMSWFVALIFAALAVAALLLGGIVGIVLAVLALVPIVLIRRARLSSDASGVTVVNLLRRQRIPWSEISDFRLGRVAGTTCLDVCRWDGSRVHSWVATSSGDTAYQRYMINGLILDLRERLAEADDESLRDHSAIEYPGGRLGESTGAEVSGRRRLGTLRRG
jgi:hypothetical protein